MAPFPEIFPQKGRYRAYDKQWRRIGYADVPQYRGQSPVNFPEDATPFECFVGGYLIPERTHHES